MIKSFRIRIYPTKEQELLIKKHIGTCRFIYNYMLAEHDRIYKESGKIMSDYEMCNLLTPLKKQEEYIWLQEISNHSLQHICRDLNEAYKNFFQGICKYPRFKKKKEGKETYPVRSDYFFFKDDGVKIEKLGTVKYKTDYSFPIGKGYKFRNPRISIDRGKYILSFGMNCENQAKELTNKRMGIDLGVKELAVVAFGDEMYVYHNINKSKAIKDITKRLKHIQRSISRKYEANKIGNKYIKTNNIRKAENEMRRLYRRISNIRLNYLHQTTHELVSKLPKTIVMENLNVRGLMKNRNLSKAIQEQCFYEFTRQMKYKCAQYGIEFIQLPRFYPSSKMCSSCGAIKSDLKLSDRTYICVECGTVIDRDYNAAINMMNYMV